MVARRSGRRGGDGEEHLGDVMGDNVAGEKLENGLDENPRDLSPPDSPFFGFSNADIPQPILIKTEPMEVPEGGMEGILEEGGDVDDDDECVVVKVTRAAKPLPQQFIKMEKEDEDDVDIFHGFNLQDLPRPIVIKEEAVEDEEEVMVERGESTTIPEYWVQQPEVPLGPVVPGDDLCDEFSEPAATSASSGDASNAKQSLTTPEKLSPEKEKTPTRQQSSELPDCDLLQTPPKIEETAVMEEKSLKTGTDLSQQFASSPKRSIGSPKASMGSPQMRTLGSPQRPLGSPQIPAQRVVITSGQEVQVTSKGVQQATPVQQQEIAVQQEEAPVQHQEQTVQVLVQENSQQQQVEELTDEMVQEVNLVAGDQQGNTIGQNSIQIIDENGQKIVILNSGEGELGALGTDESDMDTDAEDREFTVIVEEEEEEEMEEGTGGTNRDIHIDENNVIEAESIEDILAQFESESAPRSVACPNCRKCFVSAHFLNRHISNPATMCDLCNTQCCTQVNLRNHKNLECDLSKRKRNIDLIAQETAILGRKPIEPEKYYNMPLESEDEDDTGEEDLSPGPSPAKKLRSINDAKYECGLCGRYVKILDSHMKFVHGAEGGGRGAKYRCPQCSVLVTDLNAHVERRHGENAERVVVDSNGGDDEEGGVAEIVRCRHPGCDLFFNNNEEVSEHLRREHTEDMRLACGMGGCDEVFDNRGALKRHRTDAHPELEEFKPVDLENDDPDRAQDLTVACPVCERKFKHKNTCTVHIKTNHLGWTKRKLFECPDCFRSFDNKRAVDCHREAVHLGIRTVCPLCEKPVTRLDLHVRMVHTELPEWPCPDCGKKFKRKFDLNRHRVTVHLGVRNFPCDLCGKRFADMKDMTRHKNAVHYGMKIKWNSRKVKGEGGGGNKSGGRGQASSKAGHRMRREQREMSSSSAEVKLEDGSQVSIPVEYIETVETTADGGEIHIAHSGGELEGSTVILDPVLQSQLAAVQGGPGEPRVLIEADPENPGGGLRFVVIQEEDGTAAVLEESAETVEVG